ncbi:hypothetical protein [Luteimicrobium sp. DT211]|uniref:hypothetical protein n=1 Tax=Luteimicrobium sp. DT211 TaxID=3393412 RepID=UPI003CF610AC
MLALGGVVALLSWSWAGQVDGEACPSAFRAHPGSGYVVYGGEFSTEARQDISDGCMRAGAWPWRVGWMALAAGGVAAGLVVRPAVGRGRRRPVT